MGKSKQLYCILTNDVETTSIVNNCLTESAGDLVLKEGLPLLLQLYGKYNIKSTFFFCGDIIRQHPDVVKMVSKYGHEVASHGWVHDSNMAFDILTLEEQIEHLSKSKQLLESLSADKVVSFRAPALRINSDTSKALHEVGFILDSSVASQRFDMFFSFGVLKKLRWIFAPRGPYRTDLNKLWKSGKSSITEIPVSAFGIGYIGTSLRIIPFVTRIVRYLLHLESYITGRPIVFLTHPNEFIDEMVNEKFNKRRSSNFVSYIFGDVLRRKLKLRNLGKKALPLYEREILFFKRKGYEFITCQDYLKLFNEKKGK